MKNMMDLAIGARSLLGRRVWHHVWFTVRDFWSARLFHTGRLFRFPAGRRFHVLVFYFFQTVFCATSATIVSGSMAERTKFSSYCLYSAFISLVIYPIEGHWIWGGGWLSAMGFHDFAGSTAVHMTGGVIALVGASLLGARKGSDRHGAGHEYRS